MPSANPLEQLRRRMQSHATPAAFAALAEEHRRAGRFAEAIAVCRDGLARYPTYVSARVTLGRALLDSGDAETAITELEQAVAQAPDNLAAVRALDAARAACPDLPIAPPPLPLDDLTLQTTGPDATDDVDGAAGVGQERVPEQEMAVAAASPAEAVVGFDDVPAIPLDALTGGADGPQEFGLTPEWTLPDAPAPETPAWSWALAETDGPATEVLEPHADAPTTYFTPPHPQGEEPAGIWPVPSAPEAGNDVVAAADHDAAQEVAAFAWSADGPLAAAAGSPLPPAPISSLWDEPAPDTPVDEASAPPAAAPDAPAGSMWGGLFEEPVGEGAEPSTFAGWDAPGPTTPEGPAWASRDDEVTGDSGSDTGMWSVPVEAPEPFMSDQTVEVAPAHEYAWEGVAPEPDVAPVLSTAGDWDAPAVQPTTPDDFTIVTTAQWHEDPPEEGAVVPHPPADVAAAAVTASDGASEATWAGSVASALDEVFRLAGQSARPTSQGAGEPHDGHHAAMADAAVEAAMADTAGPVGPTLSSLQQMLDAVRARRAALFTDVTPH